MPMRGLNFGFYGVIADSEMLANTIWAAAVTKFDRMTIFQDALAHYMGKRWPEVVGLIEFDIGQPMPDSFPVTLRLRHYYEHRNRARQYPHLRVLRAIAPGSSARGHASPLPRERFTQVFRTFQNSA